MRNIASWSRKALLIVFLSSLFSFSACNSTKDLIDLVLDPPERRRIDTSRLALNNFFVDPEFGSIGEQFLEIRDVLGIDTVRVLMAWTTPVQPSPAATPDYNFFDAIIEAIPSGMQVIVVIAHTPDWMTDPSNWTTGNPRTTWIDLWLTPTVQRYGQMPGVAGFEIFNEPDL